MKGKEDKKSDKCSPECFSQFQDTRSDAFSLVGILENDHAVCFEKGNGRNREERT